MCTTNNNKKAKKKYTHPPMEDSRKLEDSTCLECSEHLIDYEGNIGYSNEGFPVEVVGVDFGNGEKMFLPANNYEVNIKLDKFGDQTSLTIRAVNLATGECKTVTQSHICHDAQQSYPSQFLSTKRETKQQFPMNNQRQFNPAHAYYKPVGNHSSTLHLSSYDEPKVASNGGGEKWTWGGVLSGNSTNTNIESIQWLEGGIVVYGNMRSSEGSIGSGYRARHISGSYDASNPVQPVIALANIIGNWFNNKLYNKTLYGKNAYINMDWNWVNPGDTIIHPITPGRTQSWFNSEGKDVFYTDTIFWIKRK